MYESTGVAENELLEAPMNKPSDAIMNEPSDVTADKPDDGSVHKPNQATGDKLIGASVDVDNPAATAVDDSTKSTAPAHAERKLLLHGRRPMRFQSAIDEDSDFVAEWESLRMTKELVERLWAEFRPAMKGLARHHLNLQDRDDVVCDVAPTKYWILGGFNICIPIKVRVKSLAQSYELMLRHALPHNLEHKSAGLVDEKIACEVAAYVWMQEKCPDIPIPRLYGFGFSDHRRFTHEDYRPWYVRLACRLRRLRHSFLGLLYQFFLPRRVDPGSPILLSRYTRHPNTPNTIEAYQLPSAYLLLENVETRDSQMLANTWAAQRKDPDRQQNLFRGLARIMLSLARVPLPRIGAFRFRDDGTIALTNRPLNCITARFENGGTPRVVPSTLTYLGTEAYVADVLRLHTQQFLHYRNVTYSNSDCRRRMAAWVLVRSLAHGYIQPEQRNGPFLLQLTDLHAGNIFVDKACNVTHIVDLEWVCALPVEGLHVPHWLTGQDIGGLENNALAEYTTVRNTFMAIFEEEESKISAEHGLSLTNMMNTLWTSGAVWFWYGLSSVNAMPILFRQHLRPQFAPVLLHSEEEMVSRFFSQDADGVVRSKVNAYYQYEEELKKLYKSG